MPWVPGDLRRGSELLAGCVQAAATNFGKRVS
jgi:hypothetical protein